ncbi:photosynthetic NDH subunit of lumenal location 2, chloroplastic [Cynara cardunculus var. scolymus]|uniref:photosynthetic NDH subunit of lumenal location 2, chloroplastic n=1 Tax=Cynara cardunculus var. scolymus TaxID=59895 RepID=UPI000D62872E|nr:photosynthetic NDH subunit of lumenal location 2, chloroplastic [Cynara cardunculus var. scolymus]
MTTYTNPTTLFHPQITASRRHHRLPPIRATFSGEEPQTNRRRFITTTLLTTSISLMGLNNVNEQVALAENWGTRSFIKERFFEPGLSPEDAVARIRQTREGLHSIRNMLETMSWRYVLFYIRLKAAYLSQDLKNAMSMVPETKKGSYVKAANELVDNMSEFDHYVRSPKVYESYLYYEKTLKSIDDLVAVLA